MSDNKTKKDQRDRGKVAGGEKYELAYLEDKLNVSRTEIEKAVQKVGNDRNKVEEYLKKNK